MKYRKAILCFVLLFAGAMSVNSQVVIDLYEGSVPNSRSFALEETSTTDETALPA